MAIRDFFDQRRLNYFSSFAARSGLIIIKRISGLVYTITNKMTYLCYLLRKGDNTKLLRSRLV